ncbi:hypothetical protein B0H66DRAFT_78712 [Apodospora peruviana]|uniref:Uncharacterized protein n=1 Tax=Apodospora peruviana TaxID=516989 RepID=A0AAE0LY19_9PEZI|nr:hypothetical protein B0H66DRAFT_104372 [Apodospora peruviana]KAK3330882.1 hypothetical protein B0H66DRAFT_78712 [Apodospora peruviana]
MLLTSSQVSIVLSSGIIFIFTAALFLSGYAIQQRTLRDLRAAIKPESRPQPLIFLPDQFKKSTTELPDGTIVEVEEDDYDYYQYAGKRKQQRLRKDKNGVPVVEAKPTTAQGEGGAAGVESRNTDNKDANDKPSPAAAGGANATTRKTKKQKQKQKQQSKSEGQASWSATAVEHPEKPEKPVSRQERRRLIKEELQRIHDAEEKNVYRRRVLW